MAEYEVSDPEDIIPCPYNKAHAVRAKRMQIHLIKCRKQHEISSQFTSCPFNAKHEVPKAELRYHLTVCPDRVRLNEKILLSDDNTELKGCTDVPAYKPLNIRGENWDDDIPKYTMPKAPAGYMPNSQFLRISTMNTAGLTAKQKRDLYLQGKQASETNQEPKLRAPRQTSQAVAIHLQQQKHKQKEKPPANIYEFALQKCAVGGGKQACSSFGQSGISTRQLKKSCRQQQQKPDRHVKQPGLGRGQSIVPKQGDGPGKVNGSTSSNMSSPANGTLSNINKIQLSVGRGVGSMSSVEGTAWHHASSAGDAVQGQGVWGSSTTSMGRGMGGVSGIIPTAGSGRSFLWNQELQRQALLLLPAGGLAPPDEGRGNGFAPLSVPATLKNHCIAPVSKSTCGPLDSSLAHQMDDDSEESDDLASTPDWVGDGYGSQDIGSWADTGDEECSK